MIIDIIPKISSHTLKRTRSQSAIEGIAKLANDILDQTSLPRLLFKKELIEPQEQGFFHKHSTSNAVGMTHCDTVDVFPTKDDQVLVPTAEFSTFNNLIEPVFDPFQQAQNIAAKLCHLENECLFKILDFATDTLFPDLPRTLTQPANLANTFKTTLSNRFAKFQNTKCAVLCHEQLAPQIKPLLNLTLIDVYIVQQSHLKDSIFIFPPPHLVGAFLQRGDLSLVTTTLFPTNSLSPDLVATNDIGIALLFPEAVTMIEVC